MSISLSNHSALVPSFSVSVSPSAKYTKSLESKPLIDYRPFPKPIIIGASRSHFPPIVHKSRSYERRSLSSSQTSQRYATNNNGQEKVYQNGEEASNDEVDMEDLSSWKALISVYKKALFHGDEKLVSDIEARILIMVNKKNELEKKVSGLSTEITSGKNKYIRLQADFDNFRKRFDKDRLRMKSNALGEVVESLLPMVDSFEKAKEQINPESEREKKIDTSYQSIYKQFVEVLRSLRVAAIPTVGKPFDPMLHEAIAREESQDFKEGTVIQELRRGFRLGDQVIRPATVKVSAGPGRKKNSMVTEQLAGQPTTTAGVDER